MEILEKIKELSFEAATLGRVGSYSFAKYLVPFIALPIVFVNNYIYKFFSSFFYFYVIFLILIALAILYFATTLISDQFPDKILVDKIFGIILSFSFVNFNLKIFVFGLGLFYLIHFFIEKKLHHMFSAISGFAMFIEALLAGLSCNFILRLIFWLTV